MSSSVSRLHYFNLYFLQDGQQLTPLFLILFIPLYLHSPGEEADEGKDAKSAKAKRTHFGRAVSLKNFIMRKGKSSSVDQGEGAKEGEEAAEGGEAVEEEEGGADGEAVDGEAAGVAAEETNNKGATEAAEKTPAEDSGAEAAKELDKTPSDAPVTNGENGCSNGTAEENATQNHQEEEEEETTESGLVKKSKEAGGVKDDANAKIINATTAVNSGELENTERDSDEPQHSNKEEADKQQQALASISNKQTILSWEAELTQSRQEEEEECPQNGGYHDGGKSCDQGEWEEEEELRKRDLRDAAVAIVQNVMSAATDQLERELCVNNGFNGH